MVELLQACAEGELKGKSVEIDPRTCTTVMLVSGGYPGSYEKGKAMAGFSKAAETSLLFHAGTKSMDGQTLTNGGRVLAVSSFGASIAEAVATSLANAAKIEFEGRSFRRDIGQDLMS